MLPNQNNKGIWVARTTSEKRNIAVFIASPGDLGAERERFRETIVKLNDGFGDGRGVTFEALGWEDTLAVSGRRSQGVINRDIDLCDVFILVLNRRWGQKAPDSEYSSYTEEEFQRAMARFISEKSPEIFIFFKRVDPESIADAGPQLAKVLTFRQELEDTRQFLYHIFEDADSFEQEVDQHLRAYAKDELPALDAEAVITPLPLHAIEAVRAAKKASEAAQLRAEAAQKQGEEDAARALGLALQTAEDAAEAALEGKVERARQRFAQAIVGTTNDQILFLAFEFYYRTGDLDAAISVAK